MLLRQARLRLAASTILDPHRRTGSNLALTGFMDRLPLGRFQTSFPLDQSIRVVWPDLTLRTALLLPFLLFAAPSGANEPSWLGV